MVRRLMPALVAALLLTACAETGTWQNPNRPQEDWAGDKAECQRRARDQAEQEFALREQSGAPMTQTASGQWASDMNRFSAQKRQGRLFESCMGQKGYRLVTGDPEENADADEAPDPGQAPDADSPPSPSHR